MNNKVIVVIIMMGGLLLGGSVYNWYHQRELNRMILVQFDQLEQAKDRLMVSRDRLKTEYQELQAVLATGRDGDRDIMFFYEPDQRPMVAIQGKVFAFEDLTGNQILIDRGLVKILEAEDPDQEDLTSQEEQEDAPPRVDQPKEEIPVVGAGAVAPQVATSSVAPPTDAKPKPSRLLSIVMALGFLGAMSIPLGIIVVCSAMITRIALEHPQSDLAQLWLVLSLREPEVPEEPQP